MEREPYRSAERRVLGGGQRLVAPRRGGGPAAARRRTRKSILVHTPVHASWLNQVEIYFSMIQRKVLTPNDFADLEEVELRLRLYEEADQPRAPPVRWKFDREKLAAFLERLEKKRLSTWRRVTLQPFLKRTTKTFRRI